MKIAALRVFCLCGMFGCLLGLLAPDTAKALTLEQLREQISSRNQDADPANDIRSVDALLALLPPAFKQHFTLMYHSRSLQSATEQAPRAILFGDDARLMLSFNGPGAVRGGDSVEAIAFREDIPGGRFVFQQIRFTNQQVEISAENPAICISCHTQGTHQVKDLRPNWDPYSQWAGAIGSNADLLLKDSHEYQLYRDYLSRFAEEPRYRHLAIEQLYPQINQPRSIYFGKHNKRLSDAIALLNLPRIAVQLTLTPNYELYQPAIFAALGCRQHSNRPGDIERFAARYFPPEIAKRHQAGYSARLLNDGSREWNPLPASNPNFALLNFILAPRGISTWSWSTNFTPSELLEHPRFQLPKNARRQLLASLQIVDPSLENLLDFRLWQEPSSSGLTVPQGTLLGDEECKALAKKSQRGFKRYLAKHGSDSLFKLPAES